MAKHAGSGRPSLFDRAVARLGGGAYLKQVGEQAGLAFWVGAWSAFQAGGGNLDRVTLGAAAGAGWAAAYGLLVKDFGVKGRPTVK